MPGLIDLLKSNYSFNNPNGVARNRMGGVVDGSDIISGAMQGLANILGGAARGSITSGLGIPGDINEAIVNNLGSLFPNAPALPTTNQWQQLLPGKPTSYEGQTYQKLGEMIPAPIPIGEFAKIAGNAINDAMVYGAGPLAKITPQPMRMFVGESANNWNKKAAEKFLELEKKGISPADAWKQTGTFRSPDGRLRQELSDLPSKGRADISPEQMDQELNLTAKFIHGKEFKDLDLKSKNAIKNDVYEYQSKLPSNLVHPELYNAYPSLKNIESTGELTPGTQTTGKYYKTTVNDQLKNESISANAGDLENLRSTLLHEAQHAIQQREGWGRGGSPTEFNEIAKQIKYHKDRFENAYNQRITSEDPIAIENAAQQMTFHGLKMGKLKQQFGQNPMDYYSRLLGEAESRATEARRNMTLEERQNTFPLESYDVPIEKLLVNPNSNLNSLNYSVPIPQDPHAPNYLEDVHNALAQKLIQSKGLYETTQEGPFLRVRPRNNQGNASSFRGIREEERPIQGNTTGSSGYDIPSRISDEEIKAQIKSPNNLAKQVADNYSLRTQGKPYALPQMEESSLKKQSAIGRTFMHAATEDPEYKKAIFEAYKKQMPKLIEQHNIQNYDDLVNKSYKQLAKETEDQFREMPVNMSYHKNGEGNYKSSVEMLKDVHGNNHLYVYQGGDPHDFLNAIDPETGLNTNEKFRAIHDYFGHAVHGNTFGPMGEETAWAAHSQMFSPLAKLAMTAETRGQNSVVNYSPLNAELKKNLNLVEKAMASTKNPEDLSLLQAQKDKLWGEFQFAPQKSVILPPEFSDVNYKGGMPEYIQPLIKPNPETAKSTFLTHFSNEPNLTFTDPSRYGSGIAGAESERLKNYSGAVKDRSYFYTGNPEQVKPEPGLGAYKYISEANNLYDISQDPLKLRTLAQEANRTPWRSNVNAGQTYNVESDLERLIKEHGYQGYMTGDVTAPSAALFYKTPVTRYDEVLSKINQDVHSPNYLEDLHKALAQKPIDVTDVHAPNYLEDIHNQLANQQ